MTIGKIRTVLGDIDSSKMGYTMSHEHILSHPQGHGSKVEEDHLLNSVPKAIEMLKLYKEAGGGTIIEATPQSWGRNTAGMCIASKESGVNVIATTGYICEEHGMEPEVSDWSVDFLAERMIHDIEVGMDDTTVKAGWIKCGTAYLHITNNEEKVIRAGAIAATETGVCLHAHTTAGTMGIEILEILEEENFDLSRMIVSHVDRFPDLWYHRKMLEKGAYLLYDGPGKAKYYPDQMRVDLLKQLVKDGFEDRLLLSNDMGRRSHHTVYGYGPGFNWIKQRFIPRLIEEGIPENVVHKSMYENPQKIYTMIK